MPQGPDQPTLYLHVGLHKTATTSIQLTLAQERERLAAHGLTYARFEHADGTEIANHSTPMLTIFSDENRTIREIAISGRNPEVERNRHLASLNQAMAGARKKNHDLIIAGEDISSLSPTELGTLVQFFAGAGWRLAPMACLREPYAMACSNHQERLKAGFPPKPVIYSISRRLEKLKAAFPGLMIYRFATACQHTHGPVGSVFEHLGVTMDSFVPIRANEGVSDQIARLLIHINDLVPFITPDGYDRRRSNKDTAPLWHIGDEKYYFSTEDFAEIEKPLREENRHLSSLLSEDYCDAGIQLRFRRSRWDADMANALFEAIPGLRPSVAILALSFVSTGNGFTRDAQKRARETAQRPRLKKAMPGLVDVLRDKALRERSVDIASAYHLMSLAYLGRPDGPMIKRCIEEWGPLVGDA